MEQKIIIKDPLYKQILLSHQFKNIIDSKEFQRLRYIKQTSFVDYVYPNANHTRFSHSLGVYHLMEKVLNNGLINNISKKEKTNLLLASLLHDIGHGPFSHFWESVFPHFDHEKTTIEILEKKGLNDVAKIIKGDSKYSYLISSTIDVDKLDYMARDSYFSGVSYGVAEVDFIIQHMYIKDNKIVIKPSAISSVEDLITQRVNLFKTVYYHKFSIAYDFLLRSILKRAKYLYKNKKNIELNKSLENFFNKSNTLKDILELNDVIVLNHILLWQNNKDEILKDLCQRFIERKKFAVKNLNYEKVNLKKLKKEVSKKYDINYYYSEIEIPLRIIQTDLYVEIDGKIKNLEEISDLIKFYKKQNWKVSYVIYPRDIKF